MAKKSKDRTEKLRKLLLEKREEIISELRKQLGDRASGDFLMRQDSQIEYGDKASFNLTDYIDQRLLEMKSQQVKKVEEALQRLEQGTYGTCKSCGEEIDEKRLAVMPFALMCIDCQRSEEEKTKLEGQYEELSPYAESEL